MIRILLVEDEVLLRELMFEELTESGYAVTPIATADEALRVIDKNTDFDVLLTDIRMPGEADGWALGRRARQIMPWIQVIYATGYTDHGNDLYAHERSIKKPFRHEQILALIRDLDIQR